MAAVEAPIPLDKLPTDIVRWPAVVSPGNWPRNVPPVDCTPVVAPNAPVDDAALVMPAADDGAVAEVCATSVDDDAVEDAKADPVCCSVLTSSTLTSSWRNAVAVVPPDCVAVEESVDELAMATEAADSDDAEMAAAACCSAMAPAVEEWPSDSCT